MADSRQVVRQWLETDAAFGVAEVPLRRGGGVEVSGAAGATSGSPVVPAARATNASVPVRQPVPGVSPTGSRPTMSQPRKTSTSLPPIPPGRIADLSPITRDEQVAALAELQSAAEASLKQYFTDISTRVVFGEGAPDAPVMFVGEGPGIEEDRTGRPFVGRAGQLLDKQIAAMGYQRSQVFIANIVKLRAASFDEVESRVKDRPPTPEEVSRQIWILHEQIATIRPTVIITLGAPAVKWLMGISDGIGKVRGTWLDYRGIPLMPTFHPAFLLRQYSESNRRAVWDDLQKAMEKLGKKATAKYH